MGKNDFNCLTPCDSRKTANESLYPMYFGVSCAFFAVQILSKSDFEDAKWSGMRENVLQRSAQLLALLLWKAQRGTPSGGQCEIAHKLECAEKEIDALKTLRHDDAKANEKVVSIFATQEQSWLIEKKKLRLQIGALMNQLRVFEKQKDEGVSELNEKLKELELLLQSKDDALEEEERKRKELEEKLTKAEADFEKLRESVKREAQEHASELRKLKTAFIELVSNQRQLEAELGRSLKQAEAAKHELESVINQKEESELMAQKLSMEMVKLHNDLEQKDKILSALLRKSKVDLEEKQMLLKEAKLSKVKKKQAELESEKWRAVSESRYEKHSLKTVLANNIRSKMNAFPGARGINSYSTGSSRTEKERDDFSPHSTEEQNEDLGIMSNFKRLGGWVRSEAEKYANMIEQRHHLELDAFAEQMRMKDEKLEELQWKILSMELESKRIHSHNEGLSNNVSHLRHENMKLQALLLESQDEVSSLKEQFASQDSPKYNADSFLHYPEEVNDTIWEKVKFMKSKPMEEELEEANENLLEEDSEEEGEHEVKQEQKDQEYSNSDQLQNRRLTVQSPRKEQAVAHDVSSRKNSSSLGDEFNTARNIASPDDPVKQIENPPWRMDLNAIGVSYKIKRLKQQLIMLERLIGKQDSGQDVGTQKEETVGIKCLLSLISILNKQVGRYQCLQEKADDLCKRMHGNDVYAKRGAPGDTNAKEKTKTLEHFLEETFQVQRYIVATGQKLMETQAKIASGFAGVAQELEKSAGIDMNRFADSISNLFQQVQRGLEIRIARIIGDLEGTLACEGMTRLRR